MSESCLRLERGVHGYDVSNWGSPSFISLPYPQPAYLNVLTLANQITEPGKVLRNVYKFANPNDTLDTVMKAVKRSFQ